jgi:hypothetical protein
MFVLEYIYREDYPMSGAAGQVVVQAVGQVVQSGNAIDSAVEEVAQQGVVLIPTGQWVNVDVPAVANAIEEAYTGKANAVSSVAAKPDTPTPAERAIFAMSDAAGIMAVIDRRIAQVEQEIVVAEVYLVSAKNALKALAADRAALFSTLNAVQLAVQEL